MLTLLPDITHLTDNIKDIYPPNTDEHIAWVANAIQEARSFMAYAAGVCPGIENSQTFRDARDALYGPAFDWYTHEWDKLGQEEFDEAEFEKWFEEEIDW